jgi:mannose-1-phosphate guanylyltransferase
LEAHSTVKGIVLAGGEGKRLRPLSYYVQKCMIPVGGTQRPLLEYIIRLFRHHHITDVTMLVSYKHEQIVNYFGDGSRFGVELTYCQDEPDVKGTGAALLNLYHKGLIDPEGTILVYYGDTLSNIDLESLLAQHEMTGAAATLALAKGYSVPVGVAEVKGGEVVGWAEKPTLDLHVGIGILAFDARVLEDLPPMAEAKKELDITGDVVPYLVHRGDRVQAYLTDSFWYDVGSVEEYEKLDNKVIEKTFSYLYSQQPEFDLRNVLTYSYLRRLEWRRRLRTTRRVGKVQNVLNVYSNRR